MTVDIQSKEIEMYRILVRDRKTKKKKRKRNVLPKHLERLVVMRYLSNHKTKA